MSSSYLADAFVGVLHRFGPVQNNPLHVTSHCSGVFPDGFGQTDRAGAQQANDNGYHLFFLVQKIEALIVVLIGGEVKLSLI